MVGRVDVADNVVVVGHKVLPWRSVAGEDDDDEEEEEDVSTVLESRSSSSCVVVFSIDDVEDKERRSRDTPRTVGKA